MARVERTEIGTEMYAVFEHLYSVQNRAGPFLEYCVCKGTVRTWEKREDSGNSSNPTPGNNAWMKEYL